MKLLARNKLVKTGPVDYADWNYRLALRTIQRMRYNLALSLLPERSGRLLEVGFGSGVFMPALNSRADHLYGIDVHDKAGQVKAALASEGVHAELVQAGAEALPFPTAWFDSIVVVSSLEFVSDLDLSCRQIRRVLKPGGSCIVITPGYSPVLDAGLKILTGNSASRDFGDRRQQIVPTLRKHFIVDKHRMFSPIGSESLALYHGVRLKRATAATASIC
jgi:ubiquinone/menaquinone biosynthesis C-methylase UbiE